MSDTIGNPHEILTSVWGYKDFRPLQKEIIDAVLRNEDAIALLPTGGGKSICFQIPALCLAGTTLVISPLIALMKDQVDNLKKKGVAAEVIYSGLRHQDIDRILDNVAYGEVKLLYLSPERLKSEMFLARIEKMNIDFVAIDEAHCISQWGFDFRPSYLDIAELRNYLPNVPFLALTATATTEVVQDIQSNLQLKSDRVFQKSFERKNLAYVVLHEINKLEKVEEILKKVGGCGIVYCSTRKDTIITSTFLNRRGITSAAYHGGLDQQKRSENQDKWIRGDIRVMAATNAFGMGIDKPNVRVVIHLTIPASLEAYYQEAGRAGRDGNKSFGILLWNSKEIKTLLEGIDIKFPALSILRQIYQGLSNQYQLAVGDESGKSYDFDLVGFCKTYSFSPRVAYHALRVLQKEGWIHLNDAVFQPSKLMVNVSKDRLYDFQLKNSGLDPLIKTILRTYQGAFQQPVAINEVQLSKFLNITPEKLSKSFVFLQKQGIIKFTAKKDKPQLTFLQSRIAAQNLTIDQTRYKFLKKRAEENLKSMIGYAEDTQCRSKLLLAYFSEIQKENCGQCDVCLDRNRVKLSSNEIDIYKKKIIKHLSKYKKSPLLEVLSLFKKVDAKRVIWVLSYLRDEELILFDKSDFYLPE